MRVGPVFCATMTTHHSPYRPSGNDRIRARAEAVAWAQAVAHDPGTVYLDTETTGLDGRAEIIEVAVLDVDGRVLLDTLVRPRSLIPAAARAIHGISDAMVADAPEWSDVHAELAQVLRHRTVIVYNADFDLTMVRQMNRSHGLRVSYDGWECAMRRYSSFAGEWHERYGNYRWHRLDFAVTSFGHQPGGHRARADAFACRLVVEGMAASPSPPDNLMLGS